MARTVFVVFPHQLFKTLFTIPKSTSLCFIEDERYFTHMPFHSHTLVLRRASMQAVRERLLVKGFQVEYYDITHYPNLEKVFKEFSEKGVKEISYYHTADHRLEKSIEEHARTYGIAANREESPGFLLSTKWVGTYKEKGFAKFYERVRRDNKLFMGEDGEPVGGSWMLSAETYKEVPPTIPQVGVPEHNRYVEEAIAYVQRLFPEAEGVPEQMVFPVTYADSEDWLEHFIHQRLQLFAENYSLHSEEQALLFHSGISPLINTGLLMPQQVVEAVMVYHKARALPLASLELFLRMVVGKREWLRLIYLQKCQEKNLAGAAKVSVPNPAFKAVSKNLLKRVKTLAYCHHEERVALNNALQEAGVSLEKRYQWFSSMFLDSTEWALLPYFFFPEEI